MEDVFFELWGGGGGGTHSKTQGTTSAAGGYAAGALEVGVDDQFTVVVGGGGQGTTACSNSPTRTNAIGGGGKGGDSCQVNVTRPRSQGAGGGGLSGLFNGSTTLDAERTKRTGSTSSALLIAGGGGGASEGAVGEAPWAGGGGGTTGGGDGKTISGQGGTQTKGGTAGTNTPLINGYIAPTNMPQSGDAYKGGDAGSIIFFKSADHLLTGTYVSDIEAGGGGGGWYGGGAGAPQFAYSTDASNGPGGCGSGYLFNSTAFLPNSAKLSAAQNGKQVTDLTGTTGPKANNAEAAGVPEAGQGGDYSTNGNNGGRNGLVKLQWVEPALQTTVTRTDTTTQLKAGSVLNFKFEVKKTGAISATNVSVKSSSCDTGTITTPTGDTGADKKLGGQGSPFRGSVAGAETWVYTCKHTITQADVNAGQFTNTIEMTGTGQDNYTLPTKGTNSLTVDIPPAPATTTTIESSIITSSTAAQSYNVSNTLPNVSEYLPGVYYAMSFTNTGNISLKPQGNVLTQSSTNQFLCDAGSITGPLDNGDTNQNSLLDVGEAWKYRCTHQSTTAERLSGQAFSSTMIGSFTTPKGDAFSSDPATVSPENKPPKPTINAPLINPTNSPVIAGTGFPGMKVAVKVGTGKQPCANAQTDGTVIVAGDPSTLPGTPGTWSCTLPVGKNGLQQGNNSLTATQIAGTSSSDVSASVTLNLDTIAPAAPQLTAPGDNNATANTPMYSINRTPTITGNNGEVGAVLTVKNQATGSTICTVGPLTASAWSCTPSTELPDANYQLVATQTDKAGNTSTASPARYLLVDATAPLKPVITSPTTGMHLNNTQPKFSGTGAEKDSKITVFSDLTELCSVDVTANGNWECTPTAPDALAIGSNNPGATKTISVKQRDLVGNETPGDNLTLVFDTSQPLPPTITAPTNTNLIRPIFAGTGEDGAQVYVVTDNDTAVCQATVTGGKWSCTASNALAPADTAETRVTVKVTQKDVAGNESNATMRQFRVDNTSPSPPAISRFVDDKTQLTTPKISGTAEPGSQVIVKNSAVAGSPEVCSVKTDREGTWTCESKATYGGEVTLQLVATAMDAALNTSAESSAVPVTIDVNAFKPTITAPSGYINTDKPAFTGQGIAGATVNVSITGTKYVCQATVESNGSWSCTISAQLPTPTAVTGKSYAFTATQEVTQASGTKETGVNNSNFTYDPTPPDTVLTGPILTNQEKPVITLTGELLSTGTVKDGNDQVICEFEVATTGEEVAGGNRKAQCTSNISYPLGQVTTVPLTSTAKDPAGNIKTSTITMVVDREINPPGVTYPAEDQYYRDLTKIEGTGEPGAKVFVKKGSTDVCGPTAVTVDNAGKWTCTPASAVLAEGRNQLTVWQIDPATNESAKLTRNFIIDTKIEASTLLTNVTSPTKINQPNFSGTGEAKATVTVKAAKATLCVVTVNDEGNWACTYGQGTGLTLPQLADGDYRITAQQKDLAQNISADSTALNIKVDTEVAVPTLTTTASNPTKVNQPGFSGTGEAGATVTVSDDSNAGVALCRATVNASGEWACDWAAGLNPAPAALADGVHSITAKQVDLASNVSGVSTQVSLTVDTQQPIAPTVSTPGPADGTYSNSATPGFSGNSTEPTSTEITVALTGSGTVLCKTHIASDGKWECNWGEGLTPVPQPLVAINTTAVTNFSVNVTQKDAAGNDSPATTRVFNVDIYKPAPTITLDPVTADNVLNGQESQATVQIKGTVNGPQGVGRDFAASEPVTITVGGHSYAPTLEASGSFSVDVPGSVLAAATTVSASYTHTGLSGLTGTATAKHGYTVNTATPPAPVFTNPAEGNTAENRTYFKTNPGFAGTGVTGNQVKVVTSTGTALCENVTITENNWSCTAISLPDGDYTVTATQTDPAGNTSLPGSDRFITVDSSAPEPPSISKFTNDLTTATSPVIQGTAEPYSTVIVTNTKADNTTETVCTANPVANAQGNWQCTAKEYAGSTTLQLTATATDRALNSSLPSAPAVAVTINASAFNPVVNTPANNIPSNVAAPAFTGTGVAGASIKVTSATPEYACTATVANDNTWACTINSLPAPGNDNYTFIITQTVANTGTGSAETGQTTLTYVYDTAPPRVSITQPALTNLANPVIKGQSEKDAKVTVTGAVGSNDETTLCPEFTVTNADGTWECTSNVAYPAAVTTVVLKARAKDLAGNQQTSDTFNMTVDRDITAPVITTPVAGSYVQTAIVSGTGETGAKVTVKNGEAVLCPEVLVGNNLWTCSPTVTDGAYNITATQVDAAGNASTVSNSVAFTIDTKADPPSLQANVQTLTNNNQPTFRGQAEGGAQVTVKNASGELCTTTASDTGAWQCQPSTAVADGTHNLTATQTDRARNTSAASNALEITVDTKADKPTMTTTETSPTKHNTPAFSGTAENDATVTVFNGSTKLCEAKVTGGAWACVYGKAQDGADLNPAPAVLADGEHSITATQTDLAGNTSAQSDPLVITVDTTAEAPTLLTDVQAVTKDNRPKFNGQAEVGAQVTVKKASGELCSTTASGTGAWQCQPRTALTDGTHNLTATQIDRAGNTSAESTALSITVDTAVPSSPVVTAPLALSFSKDLRPNFQGTGENGATVKVMLGNTQVCTGVVEQGQWSCKAGSDLAAANTAGTEVQLTVTQTDPADNTSLPVNHKITIDQTAPVAPAISTFVQNQTKQARPLITGTAEPSSTVTVYNSSTNNPLCGPVTADTNTGAWQCTPSGDQTGTLRLVATATDQATNTSALTTPAVEVTIIATAFTPVVTEPVANTPGKANAPVFKGTGINGAAITVTDNNGHGCNTRVSDTGTWECQVSPALDSQASYSFTVTQEITNPGNSKETGQEVRAYVYDATAPQVTITGPSLSNAQQPTITGTGEAGTNITVKNAANQEICPSFTIPGAPGSPGEIANWSCQSQNSYANGTTTTETLTATAVDVATNTNTATLSMTVDRQTDIPTLVSPSNNSHLPVKQPSFAGTGEAGATVIVSENGTEICQAVVGQAPQTGSNWQCLAGAEFSEGAHSITLTVTDLAGNTDTSTGHAFTTDYTAPTTPSINPFAGNKTKATQPKLTGIAETNTKLVVKDANGTVVCADENISKTLVPDNNSQTTWACTTAASYANGTALALAVTSTDQAGNFATSSSINVTIDADPFVPGITTKPATQTNIAAPAVAGTGINGAQIKVTDGNGHECTATVSNDTWSCTINPALKTDGAYTFTVTQTVTQPDESKETGQASFDFTYDQTAPVSSITNPALTNLANPVIKGQSEKDAKVTVTGAVGSNNETTLCPEFTVTNADGTWECTSTVDYPTAVTPVALKARATDLAGNQQTSATFNMTVDRDITSPAITTPETGSYLQTTKITGTGETGSQIIVQSGNTQVCTATVTGTSWECTPNLTNGVYTITASQTDPAGNASVASTAVTFTIDQVKPEAPVIDAPQAHSFISNKQPQFSGTGEAKAKVTVKSGETTICDAVTVADNNTWQCQPSTALTDGTHNITATQTDLAGNVSADSNHSFTIDTYTPAPGLSVDNITADNTVNIAESGGGIEVTGTVTGTVNKDFAQGEKVTINLGGTTYQGDISAVGQFNITLPGGTLATQNPAQITATYTHTGPSGLSKTVDATRVYQVDLTAPTPPTITRFAGDKTQQASPKIAGTGEDGTTITVKNGADTLCTTGPVSSGTWTCTPTASFANNTQLSLTAVSTDRAENSTVSEAISLSVILENNPFAPGVNFPAYTNQATPTISGTGALQNASIMVTDGQDHSCNTIVNDSSGNWSCTLTAALPAEKLYNFTATQEVTQPGGNKDTGETKFSFTYDKTVSHLVINSPANNKYYQSTAVTTITGTGAEAGANITLRSNGASFCAPVTNHGNGSWECTLSNLAEGQYTVTAHQVDQAGNDSARLQSAATPVTFTIDNQATKPTLTATTPALSNDPRPGFAGSGETGATVTVIHTANANTVICAATVSAGTWTCAYGQDQNGGNLNLADLSHGTHVFTAKQQDLAGNTSVDSDPVTLDVDLNKPASPVITSPLATHLANTTPTITGQGETGAKVTIVSGNTTLCTAAVVNDQWTCVYGQDAEGKALSPVPNALADGAHAVTVTQQDPAGNISDKTERTYTIDTYTPQPGLSISTVTADNVVNLADTATNITITGTVTGTKGKDYAPGEKVTITLGNTEYQGDVNDAGEYSIIIPGSVLKDYLKVIAVYSHTGPSGISGSRSIEQTYAVDITHQLNR